MDYESVKQKMDSYYSNPAFVEKWLNTPNPATPYQNHTPRQVFEATHHPNAVRFTNEFCEWMDQQLAKDPK